ncbi:MAG TPA: DinB family protein [Actinomycetota bacterium]|jgi:hypothetical protein|nr:DinB family protein [Actinomycetota bacterium]
MDRSYVAENDRERARLRDLLERMSDEDLRRPMADGWTIAAVLVHAAFWDYRIVSWLERWGPDGSGPEPTYDEGDVDWVNDSNKPIFLAIPPRVAAGVAMDAAEAADRAVEQVSDDLLAAIERAGFNVNPNRWDHRREHLDEIERTLADG